MTKELNFPDLTDVDVIFAGYPQKWFNDVLNNYQCDKEHEEMAQSLFFNGGKLILKKDKPKEYTQKGVRALKSVLGSFSSKHEHKIHVSGVILAHICDGVEQSDKNNN